MTAALQTKTRIGKLFDYLEKLVRACLVPFIVSSPGMGKSGVVHQFAKKHRLKMIDHRLSTSAPEDMTGLPQFTEDGFAKFAPFADLFPVEGTPIPEGYDGWLLFLDEFNQASKAVMSASYKLILDRMVGQHKLHPNVVIVCAGNLMSDKAIANNIGTALQSRVVHLELELNLDDWILWADDAGIDHRVISYISQFGLSKLCDFDPDHKDRTFCCPRTWEFMSRLIKDTAVLDMGDRSLYTGVMTAGVATEFLSYTKIFQKLVSVEKILREPTETEIPDEASHRYALITMLVQRCENKDMFETMMKYVGRMPTLLKIMFIRRVAAKLPNIRDTASYTENAMEIAKLYRG